MPHTNSVEGQQGVWGEKHICAARTAHSRLLLVQSELPPSSAQLHALPAEETGRQLQGRDRWGQAGRNIG